MIMRRPPCACRVCRCPGCGELHDNQRRNHFEVLEAIVHEIQDVEAVVTWRCEACKTSVLIFDILGEAPVFG